MVLNRKHSYIGLVCFLMSQNHNAVFPIQQLLELKFYPYRHTLFSLLLYKVSIWLGLQSVDMVGAALLIINVGVGFTQFQFLP